jgi:aldehyde:ferredoxin oxidoreductase
MECYEKGLITKADTDGIELTWGNHKAIVAMTEKLVRREGFGDILADGTKKAAQKIGKGSEKFAIHINGEELPAHDPKHNFFYALGYVLDATPGRHFVGSELADGPT